MANYGEAGYIGGKPWPTSIYTQTARDPVRIWRPRETYQEAPAAPAAPAAPSLSAVARTAWEKAIARYAPGGGFGKGVEAGIERGRTKAVAGGAQQLVSAGLAGTTVIAGLGKKYEEEVAMPTRARVEEARAQAIANLQAGLAAAEQRGYETAEERALRERLSRSQISAQVAMAGMQTGLGYAQLGSRERISAQELAMQEMFGRAKLQQTGIGVGGTQDYYAQPVPGYAGGGAGTTGARFGGESTIGQPVIGGPQAGGMYLGGDRFLSPEQVEWKMPEEGGPYIPTSTREAVGQLGQQGGAWQEDFGAYISPEEYQYWMR